MRFSAVMQRNPLKRGRLPKRKYPSAPRAYFPKRLQKAHGKPWAFCFCETETSTVSETKIKLSMHTNSHSTQMRARYTSILRTNDRTTRLQTSAMAILPNPRTRESARTSTEQLFLFSPLTREKACIRARNV